jgi:hypothetical protein
MRTSLYYSLPLINKILGMAIVETKPRINNDVSTRQIYKLIFN